MNHDRVLERPHFYFGPSPQTLSPEYRGVRVIRSAALKNQWPMTTNQ